MVERAGIELRSGTTTATVQPGAGGVLTDLVVGGRAILATTPWASTAIDAPGPAATEAEWVRRWRGGWQLCAPTAGRADVSALPVQGFHGVASTAPWAVIDVASTAAALRWAGDGIGIDRTIGLHPTGATVTTALGNTGDRTLPIVLAEHLILGSAVLEHEWRISPGPSTRIRDLDYAGDPTGASWDWPGPPDGRWAEVDGRIPARVAALENVGHAIVLEGDAGRIELDWDGEALPHALLWEEFGKTGDPPWHHAVNALGIEPTSAATGAGTAGGEVIALAAGGRIEWSVRLTVDWSAP